MHMLRLDVRTDAYALWVDDVLLGQLDGGAAALLGTARGPLREIDIETAIEHAEEWVLPLGRRIPPPDLRIHDTTGRLRAVFGARASLTLEQVEAEFNRMHDAVVRGQVADRDAVADAVLLRELGHHGRLARFVLA